MLYKHQLLDGFYENEVLWKHKELYGPKGYSRGMIHSKELVAAPPKDPGKKSPPFLQPDPAKMPLPWKTAVEKLCRTVIKMSPFRRPQFSLKSLKGDSDRPRAAWCPYDRGRAPPEFSSHRMGEHLSKPHPEATNSCRKVTVNKAEEGRQYWIFYWRESLCYVPYCSQQSEMPSVYNQCKMNYKSFVKWKPVEIQCLKLDFKLVIQPTSWG